MDTLLLFLLSVIPPLILLIYINRRDKERPEPTRYIVKTFIWGIVSCFLTLCFTSLFKIFGESTGDGSFSDALYSSFVEAAIPEEIAKFICLSLALRKNKYFDERMDGIVYACCIGMGFASFENILYVLQDEEGLFVGIFRAFTAIPGHFLFAVLMGYYFSLYIFERKGFLKVLLVPIMAHGIYDTICFSSELLKGFATIFIIVLIIFLIRKSKKMINEHLLADKNDEFNNQNML